MSQQTFTAEELEQTATHYAKGADRDWWPECPEVFRDEWARTTAMLTYAATLVRRLEDHNLRIDRLDAIRLKWESLMNSVPWRLASLGYGRAYTQFNADRKAEDDPPDVIRWLLNRADLYAHEKEQRQEAERRLEAIRQCVADDVRPEQAADYILWRGGFSEREIQIATKVAVESTNKERQKVRALLTPPEAP